MDAAEEDTDGESDGGGEGEGEDTGDDFATDAGVYPAYGCHFLAGALLRGSFCTVCERGT